ncbi:hypothetical protein KIL84_014624 [Mauremys mutica]|uniref:Uncharacterized protein n=1 Tax=Mauremys mutica TaxID=74926 RepID=A0A9D3XQ28_9SAUR|nr:hypothetical protein KIL84_014624 [Mauremys mutica]
MGAVCDPLSYNTSSSQSPHSTLQWAETRRKRGSECIVRRASSTIGKLSMALTGSSNQVEPLPWPTWSSQWGFHPLLDTDVGPGDKAPGNSKSAVKGRNCTKVLAGRVLWSLRRLPSLEGGGLGQK